MENVLAGRLPNLTRYQIETMLATKSEHKAARRVADELAHPFVNRTTEESRPALRFRDSSSMSSQGAPV
jgi:hypothetical protein